LSAAFRQPAYLPGARVCMSAQHKVTANTPKAAAMIVATMISVGIDVLPFSRSTMLENHIRVLILIKFVATICTLRSSASRASGTLREGPQVPDAAMRKRRSCRLSIAISAVGATVLVGRQGAMNPGGRIGIRKDMAGYK
jgi:hypothetical protein